MSCYQFPSRLDALRDWLAANHVDLTAVKSERQAAFFAQQLAGTRFKFPPKGKSCQRVMEAIQDVLPAVTSEIRSEKNVRDRDNFGSADRPRISGEAPQIRRGRGRKSIPKSGHFDRAVPAGLVIYADGACEPNPGAGGWGFAVYRDGIEIHAQTGGEVDSTNNRMEIMAALMALRWFSVRGVVEPVRLLCDSQYVVRGCNEWRHGWKKKGWNRRKPNSPKREAGEIKNLSLWQELDEALTLVPITLEWVRGHVGIVGNERADELSQIGRDEALERARPLASSMLERQLAYQV